MGLTLTTDPAALADSGTGPGAIRGGQHDASADRPAAITRGREMETEPANNRRPVGFTIECVGDKVRHNGRHCEVFLAAKTATLVFTFSGGIWRRVRALKSEGLLRIARLS